MVPTLRRYPRVPAVALGVVALAVALSVLTQPAVPERATPAASSLAEHSFAMVTTGADFRAGAMEGIRIRRGSLKMATPVGRLRWAGRTWSWSRWTSAWVTPATSFTELVPTWNARTPPRTLLMVQARARSSAGRVSGWKTVAAWSSQDAGVRRTSAGSQADAVASMATDTLRAAPGVSLSGYQLRVLPLRRLSSSATTTVKSIQAVATRPAASLTATSPRLLSARTLAVPSYSQMIHRGQYPQWGGGGEAWCSPTALSMILGYYRALPSAASYSWVNSGYADRWVDHVARATYDYGYQGTGNWAFNTAYAATRTTEAFVTRLGDLREAERFIAAGIPLAASITFGRGQLSGAPIGASAGHLVVIAGFTGAGDVVVNDPAASSNGGVRRVYDRGEFERAWQRKSNGTVYVVRDAAHPLPSRGSNRNW